MAKTRQALNQKKLKFLSGSVKTQISVQSNISGITWNWSSQTVSIQFDVAWVFFLRTLRTAWWKQKGLNAFVVIAQTLLFVSKDLQIIIMQLMVEGKRQEHPKWRNEAVFTGTDAERQEEDVCLHQPNTCFSLGAAVCHCQGFLEVANYLRDGNNLLGFERYLVVVL